MIEAVGLTKCYGRTVAVNDLSFTVKPGTVTGFLGPNGAGKSTTMRMILGLVLDIITLPFRVLFALLGGAELEFRRFSRT